MMMVKGNYGLHELHVTSRKAGCQSLVLAENLS